MSMRPVELRTGIQQAGEAARVRQVDESTAQRGQSGAQEQVERLAAERRRGIPKPEKAEQERVRDREGGRRQQREGRSEEPAGRAAAPATQKGEATENRRDDGLPGGRLDIRA